MMNRIQTVADKETINVKESWELNYWCDELNLKAEELREIIKKVGPAVHDIRVHLTKNLLLRPWPEVY